MHLVIYRALFLFICLAMNAPAQTPARRAPAQKPASAAAGERDTSALGAVALLPKDAAGRIARIEGPDGRPFPERWYVIVHDASAPRGMREFVVAEGKLVTTRALSQFADTISPEEVIGASAIKMNSDEAAGIAAQFAMHNSQQLGSVRYELAKAAASPAAVPVWELTCSDPNGQTLGTIVLHATKGTLLSFEGFEKSPIVPESEAAASAQTAEASPRSTPPSKPAKPAASQTTSRAERSPAPAPRPPPRAVPVRRPPREGPVDRVGSVFRRIFRD